VASHKWLADWLTFNEWYSRMLTTDKLEEKIPAGKKVDRKLTVGPESYGSSHIFRNA
jgi:hypothetical protein